MILRIFLLAYLVILYEIQISCSVYLKYQNDGSDLYFHLTRLARWTSCACVQILYLLLYIRLVVIIVQRNDTIYLKITASTSNDRRESSKIIDKN